MKAKYIVIAGVLLFVTYIAGGFNFVDFYFGGKKAILAEAERINRICNDNEACPYRMGGWKEKREGMLQKGRMLYLYEYPKDDEAVENRENKIKECEWVCDEGDKLIDIACGIYRTLGSILLKSHPENELLKNVIHHFDSYHDSGLEMLLPQFRPYFK